jgi:hypothetical protein
MDASLETKLSELRTKTNRQLLALVSNRLDRGLTFAREGYLRHAERAHSEAAAWLPLLSDVTKLERCRVEWKATQLRELLHQASLQQSRVQTACS